MSHRDPNDINGHINVTWSDIFAEPEGLYSRDGSWNLSNRCYVSVKNFWYMVLSTICAPIAACYWGCCIACIGFEYIWCWVPCLRVFRISTLCMNQCVTLYLRAFCEPCTRVFALLYSNIKVRFIRHNASGGADSDSDHEYRPFVKSKGRIEEV